MRARIVAYEFRRPACWTMSGTRAIPLLSVLTTDRAVAMEMVYELGYTAGDVQCGFLDLLPVTEAQLERRKRGALAAARAAVTRKLSGLELPECFEQATVAAAANAYEREGKAAKASRRRLLGKVDRIEGGKR